MTPQQLIFKGVPVVFDDPSERTVLRKTEDGYFYLEVLPKQDMEKPEETE